MVPLDWNRGPKILAPLRKADRIRSLDNEAYLKEKFFILGDNGTLGRVMYAVVPSKGGNHCQERSCLALFFGRA